MILLVATHASGTRAEQPSLADDSLLLLPKGSLSTDDLKHVDQFLEASYAVFSARSGYKDEGLWVAAKNAAPYIIYSSMYLEGTVGSTRIYFVHALDLILILNEEKALLLTADSVGSVLGIEDAPAEGGQLLFLTMGRANLMQEVFRQAAANDRFLRNLDSLARASTSLDDVAQRLFTAAIGMNGYTSSRCAPTVREFLIENSDEVQKRYQVTKEMAQNLLPAIPGRDASGEYVIATDNIFGRFHLVMRFNDAETDCGIRESGYLWSLWAN